MSESMDFSVSTNCVCFNLRRITRRVSQFFDAEMRQDGLRSTQWSILAALQSLGSSNMAELSESLGMDRTTLLRNLRPLQRDGLILIETGAHGGRVEIALTPKGAERFKALLPVWDSAQRTAVQVLGEQRWTSLLADLETVASALKK